MEESDRRLKVRERRDRAQRIEPQSARLLSCAWFQHRDRATSLAKRGAPADGSGARVALKLDPGQTQGYQQRLETSGSYRTTIPAETSEINDESGTITGEAVPLADPSDRKALKV
ncbi:hypothetical protein SAE02_62890 [Skermanella aerolata]|uniref:Uncharacterized protein n=1 Tax=Skermanella aerolata TaxID=393310 RepID=A0A512E090_9PROT|nr:hypothetical protein SAE02_62890 [Skermanella aerolata]